MLFVLLNEAQYQVPEPEDFRKVCCGLPYVLHAESVCSYVLRKNVWFVSFAR